MPGPESDAKHTYDDIFSRLARSGFRSRFHLGARERDYAKAKGRAVIASHAGDFIADRLAPENPRNDGKQTPMRGHPVFIAQHATASCCRGCLQKWHGIAGGKALTGDEQSYIKGLIMAWIDREMNMREG